MLMEFVGSFGDWEDDWEDLRLTDVLDVRYATNDEIHKHVHDWPSWSSAIGPELTAMSSLQENHDKEPKNEE